MADEDEDIVIKATLENEVSQPARDANESLDNLGDQAKQTERRLASLQRQADKTGRSLDLLAIKARADGMEFESLDQKASYIADEFNKIAKAQDNVTKSTEKHTNVLKKDTEEVKKSTKSHNDFMKTFSKLMKVVSGGLPIIKMLGVAWAGSAAIIGAGSLIQPLLQLGGQLSSLAVYGTLVPNALLSIAASMATVKVATHGMGDAIGAVFSGDSAALNKSLSKLSANAVKFVLTIQSYAPALKRMQTDVQDAFFGPLDDSFEKLLKNDLEPLSQEMVGLAGDIGNLGSKFMDFMSSNEGIQVLHTIFENADSLVNAFGDGLNPVLTAFGQLVIRVGPIFDKMSGNITTLMDHFADWLNSLSQDDLEKMFATAGAVAGDLWDVLKNVAGVIKGLVSAAGDGNPLGGIATALEMLNKYANSTEGQKALQSFFEALAKTASALEPVLDAVVSQIGTSLAPAIADVVTALSPAAADLATVLGEDVIPPLKDFIVALGPGLDVLIKNLGIGLKYLAPAFGPLGKLISDVLIAISPFLQEIGAEAGPILKFFASYIDVIIKALTPLLSIWPKIATPMVQGFLVPIANFIAKNGDKFGKLFDKFTKDLEPIIPIVTKLAEQMSKGLTKELERLVPVIDKQLIPAFEDFLEHGAKDLMEIFIKDIAPELPDLVDSFIDLSGAFVDLLIAVLPVVPPFVKLLTKVLDFLAKNNDVKGTIEAVTWILKAFASGIDTTAWAISMMLKPLKWMKDGLDAIHTAASVFTKYFLMGLDQLLNKLGPLGDQVRDFLKMLGIDTGGTGMAGSVGSGLSGAMAAFIAKNTVDTGIVQMRFAGGPVASGQPYMVGELGPEKFLSKSGDMKDIGTNGPSIEKFASDGFVIPNHMVEAIDAMRGQWARSNARMFDTLSDKEASAMASVGAGRGATTHVHENHYSVPITVANPSQDVDVERAVKKVFDEIKKDAEERSY